MKIGCRGKERKPGWIRLKVVQFQPSGPSYHITSRHVTWHDSSITPTPPIILRRAMVLKHVEYLHVVATIPICVFVLTVSFRLVSYVFNSHIENIWLADVLSGRQIVRCFLDILSGSSSDILSGLWQEYD